MKNLLFQWIHDWHRPPRWMAFAFYSCERNLNLYVAFPINLVVVAAWWLQDRWARSARAPSWIEREVQRRQDRGIDRDLPF